MIKRVKLIGIVFTLVLLTLILSPISLAIDFEGMYCEEDIDCLELASSTGMEVYCNLETGYCAYDDIEGDADTTLADADITTPDTSGIDTTTPETTNTDSLQLLLTSVQNQINFLESTTNNLQLQLNTLNSNLQAINNKLDQMNQVKTEVNSVAVGLAGVQVSLNKTSTELVTLQDDLDKRFSRNKVLVAIFIVLLAIGVGLGVMYYLNRSGGKTVGVNGNLGGESNQQVSPQIANYITKQLTAGKKYPEIKAQLLKAGWQEKDIQWAYKETVRKNYQDYLQKKTGVSKATASSRASLTEPSQARKSPGADKNKMMGIIVISLLLIAGIFFLIKGTTGQAVYFEKLVGGKVGGDKGEITYDVTCTPPHLLNPSKDGCCLDLDNNGACDYLAKEGGPSVGEGAACTDNSQCEQGTLCINSRCSILSNIYSTKVCDKSCNFYGVKIKVIYSAPTEKKVQKTCAKDNQCDDHISETSDTCLATKTGSFCVYQPLVEEYTLKPKQGSYSTVGATEWKILESPDYCQGEQAVVPIKIIYKKGREILSEEIITLREREISEDITHPLYQEVSFKLKVDKVSRPVGC
ncbi:MAG TPA: hypothetical protein VJA23_05660 [Candidatus Nanoarchaeia archaeon]|nr:hypothetical protein [Candidatus Nanoarchaeia archaeon]